MNKRHILILTLFLILLPAFLFADPDYRGGNGTIVSQTDDASKSVTVRKYETDPFWGGDWLYDIEPVLYDDYISQNKIADFHFRDGTITLLQMCEIVYKDSSNSKGKPHGELWFKINFCGKTGWICYYGNSTGGFYDDGCGEYLEVIQSGGKTWNVRRLGGTVCVYENLNVRDAPGLGGNKVYLIKMVEDHYFRSFKVAAITAEKETIDGLTDYWVKVEYEKGKFGWVFGGYTGVERGGPKFMLPETQIEWMFGDQP